MKCFVGLEMELFINQDQYPGFVAEAGVRLAIHHQHEFPHVQSYGLGIPPGKVALVGVWKVWEPFY